MSSQLGIAPSASKLSAGQVKKQQGSSQKSRNSTCGAMARRQHTQRTLQHSADRNASLFATGGAVGTTLPTPSIVPQRHSKRRPRAESKETSLLCLPTLTGLIWAVRFAAQRTHSGRPCEAVKPSDQTTQEAVSSSWSEKARGCCKHTAQRSQKAIKSPSRTEFHSQRGVTAKEHVHHSIRGRRARVRARAGV